MTLQTTERSPVSRGCVKKKICRPIEQKGCSCWMYSLLVSGLVSVMVIPVYTEDTDCDSECFNFGPSHKTDITLYYYPRDVEEAWQTCRDQNGWLFTEYFAGTLNSWLTIVRDNWDALLQSKIHLVTDGITLIRQDEETKFDLIKPMCPDQLVVNHTASSGYRISGGITMQLNQLEPRIMETFMEGTNVSFICAVEGGGCAFSKMSYTRIPEASLENTSISLKIVNVTDYTECLVTCQGYQDKVNGKECWFSGVTTDTAVCILYLTSEPLTDTNITEESASWDLYIKECFEPFVNFERPKITVYQDEYFEVEKYCDIIPREDPYNGCLPTKEQEGLPTKSDLTEEPSTSAVLASSPAIEPTPSSSYGVTEDEMPTSVMTSSINAVEITALDISHFSLEPSDNTDLTSTLMTPAERTPVEITPTGQMCTEMSSDDFPYIEMTSTLEINATEVSMKTKTSVANASLTETIVATECDCTCIIHLTSTRDRQEFLSSIIQDLEINKKNISKHIRKYKSVNMDRRWQTLSVGYLGVAMLLLIFGGILLMDLGTMIQDIKMMLDNLRHYWGYDRDDPPEDSPRTLPQPYRQMISQGDLDRYLAMAAEVCPKPSPYPRSSRQGHRQHQDNRDKHNPFVGFPRTNIYSTN